MSFSVAKFEYSRFCAILMTAVFLATGCAEEENAGDDGKPVVFVSVMPQAFLAREIAGDTLDIQVMIPPGQSPHSYSPTPKQIVKLDQAKLYLSVGVPFENQLLPRLDSIKNIEIINTARGIEHIAMTKHDHHDDHGHDHGHHHDHGHGDEHAEMLDPHLWMSPRLASEMAISMTEAFKKQWPDHAQTFDQNLTSLVSELQTLDQEISAKLAPYAGRGFYIYHPALGYFARDYQLEQLSIEIKGQSPGPRHVAKIIQQALKDDVQVIFVQPQFSVATAQTIADQINGVVVPIDPLSDQYIENLHEIANAMVEAFAKAPHDHASEALISDDTNLHDHDHDHHDHGHDHHGHDHHDH